MTFDPRELRYNTEFYYLTCVFNICFLIELIINLYAHWFWKFWWYPGCSWNWHVLRDLSLNNVHPNMDRDPDGTQWDPDGTGSCRNPF